MAQSIHEVGTYQNDHCNPIFAYRYVLVSSQGLCLYLGKIPTYSVNFANHTHINHNTILNCIHGEPKTLPSNCAGTCKLCKFVYHGQIATNVTCILNDVRFTTVSWLIDCLWHQISGIEMSHPQRVCDVCLGSTPKIIPPPEQVVPWNPSHRRAHFIWAWRNFSWMPADLDYHFCCHASDCAQFGVPSILWLFVVAL